MVEFFKTKDQLFEGTKHVIAKFEALVVMPLDEDGKPLSRPRVRSAGPEDKV